MKNKFLLFCTAVLALTMWSCKKDENKVYFENGTAPTLSSSLTGANPTVPLSFANQNNEALRFMWSNPNYQFTTGVSSQNVAYEVEIDTAGANFASANKKTISAGSNLGLTMTQGELNDALLQMNLLTTRDYNLQVRVKASLNGALPLYSNTLSLKARPYAIPPKVAIPASGKLYITGSATPASWMGGGDPENVNQRFTQVTPTLYVLNSIALSANNSFLFVPVYGDWNAKYGFTGNNNENNVNGDTFKAGGGDMKAPAVAGNYKVEVNFQTGTYKLTKL